MLQARKDFDAIVKKKFPNIFSKIGGDNIRSNAVLDIRRKVNEFIARLLPEGNEFRNDLLDQSNMYKAIKNISKNAAADLDTNLITRAMSKISSNRLLSAGIVGGGLTAAGLTGILTNPVLLGSIIVGTPVVIGKNIITSKRLKEILIKILRQIEKLDQPLEFALEKESLEEIISKL